MGRKQQSRIPGLRWRHGCWHIEKQVDGQPIYESTGTSDLQEAERYLIHRLEQIRQAKVYGNRPKRIFREAAIKYLKEKEKDTLADDAYQIKILDPFIGKLELDKINNGCLLPFIKMRREQDEVSNRTINKALEVVRQILNLAHREWFDEHNLSWLASAPKIKLLSKKDQRPPYPISWEEQDKLFSPLPRYLKRMCLFKVNTGIREEEVCELKWEWEIPIPELNTSVFLIPGIIVKNEHDRLVVLNDVAKQIIDEVRGEHPVYVFTCARWGKRIVEIIDAELLLFITNMDINAAVVFMLAYYFSINAKRNRIYQMNNNSWQSTREKVGLPQVRIHDLKHTFGRRLRAAGINFEDRQDLLGHKSERITKHYSPAEIKNLIDAANKVCRNKSGSTATLTILRLQKKKDSALLTKQNIVPLFKHQSTVEHSSELIESGKNPAQILPVTGKSCISV